MIVDSNIKISISDREKEELIKNFKIGVLCQLQKEGYITEEQLNKMIKDVTFSPSNELGASHRVMAAHTAG